MNNHHASTVVYSFNSRAIAQDRQARRTRRYRSRMAVVLAVAALPVIIGVLASIKIAADIPSSDNPDTAKLIVIGILVGAIIATERLYSRGADRALAAARREALELTRSAR